MSAPHNGLAPCCGHRVDAHDIRGCTVPMSDSATRRRRCLCLLTYTSARLLFLAQPASENEYAERRVGAE